MNLDDAFVIFGWVYIGVTALLVLGPWLTGREDLVTTKNLFLVGSMNFVGVACITTGSTGYYVLTPSRGDFGKFVLGIGMLLATIYITYYGWKLPRRLAERASRVMPVTSGPAILVLSIMGAGFAALGALNLFEVQFIGQLLMNFAVPLSTICFGVVFWKWWTNRFNGFFLTLTIALGLVMLVVVMSAGTSRRPLLGLFTTLLIIMYWSDLRYRSPMRVIAGLLVPVIAASVVISGYSVIRHQILDPHRRNPVEVFLDRMANLTAAIREGQATGSIIEGETTVSCTLACIDQFETNGEPNYFHTFKYVLVNPVPRAWWPAATFGEKPIALGEKLPRDMGEWQKGYVNWGVGIIGHAYYDGGVWMVIIYGVILGFFFRFFDEKLRLQPTNGFVLGTFGAISSNTITFSRGDIATFSLEIIASLISGWMLARLARFVWGTEELATPEDEEGFDWDEAEEDPLHPAGARSA